VHLLYACVSMMFWRVPAHLKSGLTVEQWTALVKMTAQAIDWLDANERGVYDVWLLVAYAAMSCALVQVSIGLFHFIIILFSNCLSEHAS
jgi:hypothetical protein